MKRYKINELEPSLIGEREGSFQKIRQLGNSLVLVREVVKVRGAGESEKYILETKSGRVVEVMQKKSYGACLQRFKDLDDIFYRQSLLNSTSARPGTRIQQTTPPPPEQNEDDLPDDFSDVDLSKPLDFTGMSIAEMTKASNRRSAAEKYDENLRQERLTKEIAEAKRKQKLDEIQSNASKLSQDVKDL